tara:strand:- start:6901 stop:7146 length:246 start_codon:yes stop_codon:yes gene_type:complete
MNKVYLDSLNKDQLETRIYDLENELRQEWYQEKIMTFKTARKLEGEVAYCKALLENFKPVENDFDREIRLNPNFNQKKKEE